MQRFHPPVGITEEQKTRALDALRNGASMREAAEAAGVSRQALYDLKARDAEFLCEVNRIQFERRDGIVSAVMRRGQWDLEQSDKLLRDESTPLWLRGQLLCSRHALLPPGLRELM